MAEEMAGITDDQNKFVKEVMDAYEYSCSVKEAWMEEAMKGFQAYNCKVKEPDEEEEGERRSRVSTSNVFTNIEEATAKAVDALFPNNIREPIVRAIPSKLESFGKASSNEKLLNYQYRRMRVRKKGELWLRNYFLFGIAPIHPYWRYEEIERPYREPITVRNPFTGRTQVVGYDAPRRKKFIKFDGPDFDVIDVEDFFPDSASRGFNSLEMRHAVIRKHRSYEWVKKQAEMNHYSKQMFNQIDPNSAPPERERFRYDQEKLRNIDWKNNHTMTGPGVKGIVELLEFVSMDKIITIANRKIPLRAMENPYYYCDLPVIVPTRLPTTNYPWGKSLIEPIRPTHEMINALSNLRLDNLNRIINHAWTVIEGMVDKSKIKNLPDWVVEVGDHDDIRKLDMNDVTPNAYREAALWGMDMDRAMGSFGPARGEPEGSVRSGIQQISLMEAAGQRVGLDIQGFVHGGLIPLTEFMHSSNQQFLTEDQIVSVIGDDFNTEFEYIPLEDVYGEFDFMHASRIHTIPKSVEAQQKMALINSMAAVLSGFPDLTMKLFKTIASYSGHDDVALVLDLIIKQVEMIRMAQGGVLNVTGAGNQALQGPRGAAGEGTSANNVSGMENTIDVLSNELSVTGSKMQ